MKRGTHGKKEMGEFSGTCDVVKDRRKAYYHGKYNREIFSIVLLLAIVGMLLIN